MAWSIFSQPSGDLVAEQWAIQALQTIGAPTTPGNIQFMYQWQKSEGGGGKYNPLNQGPVPGVGQLTSTGQQDGGGAADYVSWNAGLAGFTAYMSMPNYSGVASALRANNPNQAKMLLWSSPWASSHYGNGANWSNASLPSLDPTATAAAGAAAGLAGNASSAAQKIWADVQGGADPQTWLSLLETVGAGGVPGAIANQTANSTGDPNAATFGQTFSQIEQQASSTALGATKWGDLIPGLGLILSDLTQPGFWKRIGVFTLGGALTLGGMVIFLASTDTGKKAAKVAGTAALL